jgi:hypothetical protein
VATVRSLDGIHGKRTNGIRHIPQNRGSQHLGRHPATSPIQFAHNPKRLARRAASRHLRSDRAKIGKTESTPARTSQCRPAINCPLLFQSAADKSTAANG